MLRLRALVLPLTLLMALSAYAQKNTKPPKEESCSVSGMVMKMAGSAPLRKAHVALSSVEDQNRTVSAITNVDGHFAMKGIEPGSYRLSVSRLGFVTGEYGQRNPDTPGADSDAASRAGLEGFAIPINSSGRHLWQDLR